MDRTYYLGLSMAGTVSAGTYTAGCLIELDNWLKTWRAAIKANQPVKLIAQVDAGRYKKGDEIELAASEIPNHNVKITSMTGSSGGGVSAMLYAIDMATEWEYNFLEKTWMNFNIEDMLNTGDIGGPDNNDAGCDDKNKPKKRGAIVPKAISALNVLPIEKVICELRKLEFAVNNLPNIDYVTDHIEIYQTLSNYEAIPYNLVMYGNKLDAPGTFHNHFDYVRYSISKHTGNRPPDSFRPFRHDLQIEPGILGNNAIWQLVLQSTPATGAFPIGFAPREVDRTWDEYQGKLFYLKYSLPGSRVNYIDIDPAWKKDTGEKLKMKYFDGGTFDDEPHDLARASILRYLNYYERIRIIEENTKQGKDIKEEEIEDKWDCLPNKGIDTIGSIILINPFPTHKEPVTPGQEVKDIPSLFQQPSLLISALMDQGRFHSDWIEKVLDEQYYSRYIISPDRPNKSGDAHYLLAGAIFNAFGGFLDQKYRKHDYELGHYNTYKFLFDSLALPVDNVVVDYYRNAEPKVQEKYEALGWATPGKLLMGKELVNTMFCQIIPCFVKHEGVNKDIPDWPKMDDTDWQTVRAGFLKRAKLMAKNLTGFSSLADDIFWLVIGKSKVNEMLDGMEKALKEANLL